MTSTLDVHIRTLTLPYLCAAVGLNEFKLKASMHYRFNSTPHRMLQEIRMRKVCIC